MALTDGRTDEPTYRMKTSSFWCADLSRPSVHLSSKAADFFPPRPIFTLQKELLRKAVAGWGKAGKIEPGILDELGRTEVEGRKSPSIFTLPIANPRIFEGPFGFLFQQVFASSFCVSYNFVL